MRLELGSRVDCTDESFGKLADVVIDPTSRRVTHLVVERDHEPWQARLVPVELAERGEAGGAVALRATVEEVRRLPPVHEVAYLRLDGFPVDDPDWDIGIEEVLALPHYPSYDLAPAPVDFAARYDRVPKGEVEIRRESVVDSADGHRLGQVDGLLVDENQLITHVVLEQGDRSERREVVIPIGAVARVETDAVTLSLTKDEVGALPPVAVRRWPRPLEHRSRGGSTDKEGA
jgi:sporulation protein YlmC with PRC-barrel domain